MVQLPLFLRFGYIMKWVSGDANWILSNKGSLNDLLDHACPSPPFPAPKGLMLSSESTIGVPKHPQPAEGSREVGRQLYFCPAVTRIKGYSSKHTEGWDCPLALAWPQEGKVSKATNLSSISCLYQEETSHTFFLCPWTIGQNYGLTHTRTSKTRSDNFYLLWPDMCKEQRTTYE